MDTNLAALTALLLDPFLTAGEAAREAAATPRCHLTDAPPRRTDRRDGRDRPRYAAPLALEF